MSPAAYELLAASSFPEERRRYYQSLATEADLERVWRALEEEGDRAQRRLLGAELANLLGVPTLARIVEILTLSERRESRERAAELIVSMVTRQAAAA